MPEDIPHLSSPVNGTQSHSVFKHPHSGVAGGQLPHGVVQAAQGSPVKESSFLHQQTSVDEVGEGKDEKKKA
jgi:hypothetical protein